MIPFVMIDLDKPRKLRFGMGATIEYEQVYGEKLQELDPDKISVEMCAQLAWIMLKQEDPDLTYQGTIQLIDEYADNMVQVIEAVGKAVSLAYPDTEGNIKNALKTAKKGS